MKTKQMSYGELEFTPNAVITSEPAKKNYLSGLHKLWNFVIEVLTKEPEIKIWQKRDRAGNTWLEVYDPVTNSYQIFSSEQEVIAWLEKNRSYPIEYRNPWY